jgi:hypothetical protein
MWNVLATPDTDLRYPAPMIGGRVAIPGVDQGFRGHDHELKHRPSTNN